MEDDKKKRKINKKKKKKKNATEQTESVTLDARESTSDSQSLVLEIEQNNNGQVSEIIDSSNDVGGRIDVDKGGNHANSEGTSLAEKHYWLDREAGFRQKIKELEAEKDAQIQKESLLEEKSSSCSRKMLKMHIRASEREKVEKLQDEKNASMQTEARLKEKLMQLEKEKDALSHNEDIIEQKILQLQKEVEVHLQKEASLETKFLQLEGEKSCWVQKENSAKESVVSLTNENTKLQAQVTELEQSRESLLEENQQLSQTVSSLQLQINNLKSAAVSRYSSVNNKVTSEDGDVNYQIETEGALVDRLMMENSELVEKVKELYAELDRRGLRREQFSTVGSATGDVANPSADNSVLVPDLAYGVNSHHITHQATDSVSEASKIRGQFWGSVIVEDQKSSEVVKVNDGCGLANTSEITEADEIVQIPLDESEFKENKLGAPQGDEKIDVLLSDAPLIGAPFRLISFVARYVSGADLVDKNTGK
ncbi:hypothetical protein OROGR_024301 [Orobanche gracilis]